MIDKSEINSDFMIGNCKNRFEILKMNPNHNLTEEDWRVWYNGWIEGRFAMLHDLGVYE